MPLDKRLRPSGGRSGRHGALRIGEADRDGSVLSLRRGGHLLPLPDVRAHVRLQPVHHHSHGARRRLAQGLCVRVVCSRGLRRFFGGIRERGRGQQKLRAPPLCDHESLRGSPTYYVPSSCFAAPGFCINIGIFYVRLPGNIEPFYRIIRVVRGRASCRWPTPTLCGTTASLLAKYLVRPFSGIRYALRGATHGRGLPGEHHLPK